MSEFSFVRAWTRGLGFFSGAAVKHAVLLVGVGILLPIAIQLLLTGQPSALMSSAAARAGVSAPAVAFVAAFAGSLLQAASFFASARLGLRRDTAFRTALVFGLLAGLLVLLGFFALVILFGLAAGAVGSPFLFLLCWIAVMGFVAIVWTTFAALFAVGVCLLFLIVLGIGAAGGDLTFAATVVGGGGWVWTLLVAGSLLVLWLAARLSCTTMLMAERKSFNLVAAMRESWSLTWDDEWRIVRYLGLLGLAVALILVAAIVAAGVGLSAALSGASPPAGGVWGAVAIQLLAIPFAYLSVLVPAGIYRELAPVDYAAVEVFA